MFYSLASPCARSAFRIQMRGVLFASLNQRPVCARCSNVPQGAQESLGQAYSLRCQQGTIRFTQQTHVDTKMLCCAVPTKPGHDEDCDHVTECITHHSRLSARRTPANTLGIPTLHLLHLTPHNRNPHRSTVLLLLLLELRGSSSKAP